MTFAKNMRRGLLPGLVIIVGLSAAWWFLGRTAVGGFWLAFLTPINFYGKVVDHHGAPVADADVKLYVNDKPLGKSSKYFRKTDAAGTFSLTWATGITLGVEVSKLRYRRIPPKDGEVTSSGFFEYGLAPSRGPHRSTKGAPTIFTLYKIGMTEPLVKVGERNFRLARDGSPMTISLDGRGGHQVIFRCWNGELGRPPGQQKYDWRLEVGVPGGGLMEREDAFAFEAPEGGYGPSDTIQKFASQPWGYGGWNSSAERSYFFHFADGTCARAEMRMQAGGDHFVVWESFFNAKPGSRNLESDPGPGPQAP